MLVVNAIVYLLLSIIMSLDHIIMEVGSEHEVSDCYSRLDEEFFLNLHQTEIKYIKLKYGRKSKESEKQLGKVIMDLVAGYTDCIDYFGESGDAAVVYFQVKIKQINKYFQFLSTQIIQTPEAKPGAPPIEFRKDLGSISQQTGTELLPQEERDNSVIGKDALNHKVMVSLQSQDIKSHINENMKKEEKMLTAIAESLKKQEDILMKRKRVRTKVSNKRMFLSFSERNLDNSRSSDNSQLMFVDLEALQANSPEELKEMALRMDGQGRGDPISQNILEKILEDD